ncbi:MAG: SurA N-terminal domain-containing protein [Omnitrophica bacterium]|nr:SurA N-terminal domain-containing protein [Candidatus Omnitrophota bacterium]
MLGILRKKKTMKRILWGLAIIIIPAFVLWGAGNNSKKKLPYNQIGTIDGAVIPVDDFIKSVQDTRVSLFLNYFNQPETLRGFQNDSALINRLTWDNLIMTEKAKKERLSVSDEEVVNFVTQHPLFARGGIFDDKLYNYILRNSLGMMPRAFEESVRNLLIYAKYREGIVGSVIVSEEELREVYKKETEKVKLYYVVIDRSLYTEIAEVSEDEIDAFYEKNKDRFKEPGEGEAPERIKTKDEVTDSIVRSLKDKKSRGLAKEAAEDIYKIAEDKGRSLKNSLKKYRSQKKLRRKQNNRKKDILELRKTELISRSDYVDGVGESRNIVEEAFKLEIGKVSKPIVIRKGFALIEPIKFQLMDEEEFEKQKETRRAQALATKQIAAFQNWLNKERANTTLAVDLSKL